jgi:PQQ-dependent catabolism-associated CXXCW motif protein
MLLLISFWLVPFQARTEPATIIRKVSTESIQVAEGGMSGTISEPSPDIKPPTDTKSKSGVKARQRAQTNLMFPVEGPTPTTIPGATVVTTKWLYDAINQGKRLLVIDALGETPHPRIPTALLMPNAGNAVVLPREDQLALETDLVQLTKGDRNYPIVFYCLGVNCRLSYNAALRALASGFKNIYWYRGGLQAWQAAGHPVE